MLLLVAPAPLVDAPAGLRLPTSPRLRSLLLHGLVEAYGWRDAYLRSGIALLAYAPVAALVLRSRPEDIGLRPDGDAPLADSTPQTAGADATVEGWRLGEAMRTAAFWIIVLSNALQWGVGAGLFVHLESTACLNPK